jgi:hypothetical protein
MKHRFVSLMLACLTLSAGSWAVTSAEPVVPAAPGDVEILINGMPQRRYAAQSPIAHSASARSPHEQRWYVEALKGREYAVRIHNPYPGRVAVALSVEGLNTIDARHTAAGEARKWVLSPHETITISGWQVNSREARRFEFTTEEKSYGQVARLQISARFQPSSLKSALRLSPMADYPAAASDRRTRSFA